MTTHLCSYVFAVLALLGSATSTLAQDTEMVRLVPPEVVGDPFHNMSFGIAVALSGEWLFVSDNIATGGTGTGIDYGEVYIYRDIPSGWELMETLWSPSGGVTNFGRYLGVDGGRLVVGSPLWDRGPNDDTTGRVDVYELQPSGSWMHTAEVFPWGVECPFGFGARFALSGDRLAVSSLKLCGGTGGISRRIHMFDLEQGTWSLNQTLTFEPPPYLAAEVGSLGGAMALQGDTLVVGTSTRLGSALVYRRLGGRWKRIAVLTDPLTTDGDRLGTSVDIDGATIVVGADAASSGPTGAFHSGAAVVFEELTPNQWTKVQRLRPSTPFAGPNFSDLFGASVAIDGDEIVVGSQHGQVASQDTGVVYYYKRGPAGWPQTETLKYVSRSPATSDRLGVAVDIQQGIVVAGLLQLTTMASTGFALIFGVRQGMEYCGSLPSSTGAPTLLRVVGSDQASEEALMLNALDAPPLSIGGFIASANQTSRPWFGGLLCLAAPITRVGPITQADQVGDTIQRLDFGRISHLWSPGATLNFQYWYSDSAAHTTGLSNPIELTLR